MSENPFAVDKDFESQIASYLGKQTNFFLRHPDVLRNIRITHESGQAVSLFEHKLRLLEDESARYQSHLMELVDVARENERLSQRLHQLTLRLIEANTLHEVSDALKEELRDRFGADCVDVRLFLDDGRQTDEAALLQFALSDKPVCGRPQGNQLGGLFLDVQTEPASVALIPLRTTTLRGLLAIGSNDADRYSAGKGVDFLIRLGELVSLSLQSVGAAGELTRNQLR